MTDSELTERMDDTLEKLREAIEERGALLELDKKADLRWAGTARTPYGKLMIATQKTGKQPGPESKKPVAEALVDLTLEGRLIGRLFISAAQTEVELPGGGRRPFDHSGIAKMFSGM